MLFMAYPCPDCGFGTFRAFYFCSAPELVTADSMGFSKYQVFGRRLVLTFSIFNK